MRLTRGKRLVSAVSLAAGLAVMWSGVAGTAPLSQAAAAQTPEGPARPQILGIAHVAFRVSAMPAAQAFYGGVLGLAAMRGGAAGSYRVNGRQSILIEPGLPADADERLSHLSFETGDLEALAAYLKSRGVTANVVSPACARKALRVDDPDGHTIEFVEASPAGAAMGAAAPSAGAPAVSTRLLHAGLTIKDAAAADRFYKDVLGFSEIWRGGRIDTVTSWINMRVPDGTDYLEYMLVDGPPTRQQLGSQHHVALLVPDIQNALEVVRGRTPAPARAKLAAPQVGRNKRWQLNLFDPDGTRTELMEPFTMRQ